MTDKKSLLSQAANKLKNAKKNSVNQNDKTKGIKNNNAAGDTLTVKIKETVSKFGRD